MNHNNNDSLDSILQCISNPFDSSTVLYDRAAVSAVCAPQVLLLVNTLSLIELILLKGSEFEQNAGTTFQVVYANALPIYKYKDGAIDEYTNEHTVQQTMQVQATATVELGAGTLSASHRLTRGGYELIMSGLAISMHVNSSCDVWRANENLFCRQCAASLQEQHFVFVHCTNTILRLVNIKFYIIFVNLKNL